jgi:hypothetical protein
MRRWLQASLRARRRLALRESDGVSPGTDSGGAMNRVATAALGVGAVVVVGYGAVALGLLGFKEDVSFNLQKDAQGVCKPSDPGPMNSGWLRKVTWTVTNVDCDPQYVSIRNFKESLGGGSYGSPEAITKPNPVDGGPIATGGSDQLKAKIEKFVLLKATYKYEIWIGPTAGSVTLGLDPDIDIWP